MAIIPTSNGRVVAPAQAPQLRAPVQSFGGGATARPVDLSSTANLAADIYQQERKQADQIAVMAAAAKLSSLETDTLWNPQTGALNTKGKDAFGVPERVAETWQKGVDDIEGTLTTDEQKLRFRQAAQSHGAAIHEQVTSHVAAQRTQYANEVTTSYVENELNAAIASFQDPKRVDESIANQVAAITDQARRAGKSPEWIAEHTQKVTSQTRYNVLRQYLDTGSDLTALSYFEKHKSELVGADLQNAEKLTEAGSVRAASQREADRIVQTTGTLEAALTATDAIVDPRTRDETDTRIRRHYADVAANAQAKRQEAFQQASAIVEKSGGNYDTVPLSLRMQLHPSDNATLQHRADQIRHPKEEGDSESYFHLLNLAGLSDESKQQFLSENLLSYPGLSTAQRTKLLNLQRTVRNQDATGDRRDETHAAQAEALRFQRENELLKIGDPASKDYIADKKARDEEVGRIKRHFNQLQAAHGAPSPTAPAPVIASPAAKGSVGDVDLRQPLAGVLTEVPTIHPTPQMLEGAGRNPKYAAYLRSMGVDLPAVLPKHEEPKK